MSYGFLFPKSLRRCRRTLVAFFFLPATSAFPHRSAGRKSVRPTYEWRYSPLSLPRRLVEGRKSVELLIREYNTLMSCNIHTQQPLNKPVHKTFGGEKKKESRCGVPLALSFQQSFLFAEDLLRVYLVIYQHIIYLIQQFNKISEVFKHVFGDGVIPAHTVLGQIASCTVIVVAGVSFQHSCTTFRTCDFSTLTCEQTSNGMMSLRQKETELTPTLAMMSSSSSAISISKRLRLLRTIFRRASVSSRFGLNHMRLSFSVDSFRFTR